jgi:hypothetical protein
VNVPIANPQATHPDIQEILRKRRETLNRVKADLERVERLQQDFWSAEKPADSAPKNEGK